MVQVLVIGGSEGADEMLERRIGGILRGLARVRRGNYNDPFPGDIDLVVFYGKGKRLREMQKRNLPGVALVGAELTLLPAGLKELQKIKPGQVCGVVAEHQRCANIFLSEIIRAGFVENRFVTGTFQEIERLEADCFIVSEEMAPLFPPDPKNRPLVAIPRTVSPESAAEIINLVLEIGARKLNRTS
jgi:hypothetical protein